MLPRAPPPARSAPPPAEPCSLLCSTTQLQLAMHLRPVDSAGGEGAGTSDDPCVPGGLGGLGAALPPPQAKRRYVRVHTSKEGQAEAQGASGAAASAASAKPAAPPVDSSRWVVVYPAYLNSQVRTHRALYTHTHL